MGGPTALLRVPRRRLVPDHRAACCRTIAQALPSYWLVQASHVAPGRPGLELHRLDRGRRVVGRRGRARSAGLPARHEARLGLLLFSAAPGTYPRPVCSQRSRCESGAVPQLRCLPSGRTSQVAYRHADRTSALGGRAVRRGASRRATSLRYQRRFFMVSDQARRGFALATLCSARGSRCRANRIPGHREGGERVGGARREADADRLALADRDRGPVRDRRRQAGRRRRRPV